jgi:hypothetical protein
MGLDLLVKSSSDFVSRRILAANFSGRAHAYRACCHLSGCSIRVSYCLICVVFLLVACRYIAAELLELGSKNSDLHRRRVLTARDVCLAIRQDTELQQCFGAFEIGGGGRVNSHNIISIQDLQLKEWN